MGRWQHPNKKKTSYRGASKVAKKKKTRKVYVKRKGKRRKSSSSAGKLKIKDLFTPAAWGYFRNDAIKMHRPYSQKIPAGRYTDEAGNVIAAYGIGHFMKKARKHTNEIIKNETFMATQKMRGNGPGLSTGSSSSGVVYG